MIRITCELWPFGHRASSKHLLNINISSGARDREVHYVDIVGGPHAELQLHFKIPKAKSGHQNVLHTLRDALNAADLDSLGKDYIPRGGWSIG